MNNPIKRLTLDVNKAQNYETITVKQGDENSRVYKITLTSSGQTVTLAAGDTVQAKAERGGKTVALINCPKNGNEITLTLSPAMLAVAGDLRVEIMVYSGSAKLTSATQIFKVSRSISESPIVESPDFSALNKTMEEFADAIGKVTDSTEVIAARGNETLLPDRLRKIESGERITQGAIKNEHLAYDAVGTMELVDGAVTIEKIADDAKDTFAEKVHTHTDYAGTQQAGAVTFLNPGILVKPESIKSAVNSAAILAGAVTTRKIADGAITDAKIGQGNVKSIADDFAGNGIIGFDLEKLEKTIATDFNSGLGITCMGYSIPFKYDGRNFKYLFLPSVKMQEDGALTFMLCTPAEISGKQIQEADALPNRKTKVPFTAGVHSNVSVELGLDYSGCVVGETYLICIYAIKDVASPLYNSGVKFQLSNVANVANVSGVIKDVYKNALWLQASGAYRWATANAGVEYYITVQCALGTEYPYHSDIKAFVAKQIAAGNKPLQMANYLPDEIPAVVGDKLELFTDSIFAAQNISNYRLKIVWQNNAWNGEAYDRKISWTPTAAKTGSHALTIYAYDDYGREISKAQTTIKVYPVANPAQPKNLLIIGDSLTRYGSTNINGGDETSTVATLYSKLQDNGITNINLIGTQNISGINAARHEGREGWKTADYLNVSKSPFAVDGVINFKGYCDKNGYSGIDYCMIHLNWNDTYGDYSAHAARLKSLADKVVESYPECKIMFVSLASYSKTRYNFWRACTKEAVWNVSKALEAMTASNQNYNVIHLLQERDCEYNNNYKDLPANGRCSTTMRTLVDHVHGGAGEYQQIADTYFRAIVAQLNKDNQ